MNRILVRNEADARAWEKSRQMGSPYDPRGFNESLKPAQALRLLMTYLSASYGKFRHLTHGNKSYVEVSAPGLPTRTFFGPESSPYMALLVKAATLRVAVTDESGFGPKLWEELCDGLLSRRDMTFFMRTVKEITDKPGLLIAVMAEEIKSGGPLDSNRLAPLQAIYV